VITIKNRLRKIKVNVRRVKCDVKKMLDAVGCSAFDIGIWLTTNKTIQAYNKTYCGKDRPTDILSFPYHQNLKPGEEIVVEYPEDKNLGDIIISLEYAKKSDLNKLLVHGIAHLLGYDHKTDKEYKIMQKKEQQLLDAL